MSSACLIDKNKELLGSQTVRIEHKGSTQEKAQNPPATQQGPSENIPVLAKQPESRPETSAFSAPADILALGSFSQQSSSSATAVPPQQKAAAEGSGHVSPGAIPFVLQPSPSQILVESSSSAAMLQRPPKLRHPFGKAPTASSQQAEDITATTQSSKEEQSEEGATLEEEGASKAETDSAPAHHDEPEHDDGPMEEIQLHTDTESASNEPQEEALHYPSTAVQSAYPSNDESHLSEPFVSNVSTSIQQSTQAASAAIAEAIAAANRAAERSSGGMPYVDAICAVLSAPLHLLHIQDTSMAGALSSSMGAQLLSHDVSPGISLPLDLPGTKTEKNTDRARCRAVKGGSSSRGAGHQVAGMK